MSDQTITSLIEKLEVHPSNTALRAVDACGGTYSASEEASEYALGHKTALTEAMLAVGHADGITAALLTALVGILHQLSECGVVLECMAKPTPLIELLNTARASAAVEFAEHTILRAQSEARV